MDWNNLEKTVFPSFEEGWPRRSSKCNATLDSARPGRSNHSCDKVLTSPLRPIKGSETFCLKGAATPPRRRGKILGSNSFTPSKPTPTVFAVTSQKYGQRDRNT